jgi:hypothetical protein
MIVGAPPLQMDQELWSLLCRRPGATSKGCHAHGGRSDSRARYKRYSAVQRGRVRGLASLRADSVPRRMTWVTRTSLRRR